MSGPGAHFKGFTSRTTSGTGSGVITIITIPRTDGSGTNWPQQIALFWPNQVGTSTPIVPIALITGLHGGSGNWINFSRNLGFLKTNSFDPAFVDWDYLARGRCLIAIANGSFCTLGALAGHPNNTGPFNPNGVETVSSANPAGVQTWSAGLMWSGQNDENFLLDWVNVIRTDPLGMGWGTSIPRYLFGHSNGGMMAQYMWRRQPTSFTKYGGISCPLVDGAFTGGFGGADPVASGKPFCAFYGGSDDVLNLFNGPAGSGDHFFDNDTVQATIQNSYPNPGTGSTADVLYNPLIYPYFFAASYVGPWIRFAQQLVSLGNYPVPTPTHQPMASGAVQDTWIDITTGCVLQRVATANHDISSQEQVTGRRRLTDLVNAWGGNYSALNPGV